MDMTKPTTSSNANGVLTYKTPVVSLTYPQKYFVSCMSSLSVHPVPMCMLLSKPACIVMCCCLVVMYCVTHMHALTAAIKHMLYASKISLQRCRQEAVTMHMSDTLKIKVS